MALIIFTACSGTGKSTIVKALTQRHPRLKLSVSHTTRLPRPNEVDGGAYHFINHAEFEDLIKQEAFVEWAEYAGNFYGTSHMMIREAEARGDDLIFEVEVKGAEVLKAAYPHAISCFLLPPTWAELERRLRTRDTETEEVIQARLAAGQRELKLAQGFEYLVTNDQLEVAVDEVSSIYRALKLTQREQEQRLHQLIDSSQLEEG
jgi:guanylate kinase